LRSPAEAALYVAATRVLVVGQLSNQAIGMAAQPQLSSLVAKGEYQRVNDVYRTTTGWIILLNGPIYLLVAVFAPLLLRVFGSGYGDAAAVTVLLCVAAFIGNAVGFTDVVLSMAGRTSWNLANGAIALVVQVGVDVALIPHLGAMGAAIGWAASILTANLVPLAQLRWSMDLHPFGRETALAALVVLGAVGVPCAVFVATFGQSLAGLLAATASSAVLLAVASWLLRGPLHLRSLTGSLGNALSRRGRTQPST
jgi:O-antigen/teichoic acid export membrane protein